MGRRQGTSDSAQKKNMFIRVGKYLRQTREAAGVTQQAISDHMGLTTGQYPSNIERGISPPSIDYLKAIKQLCGVSRGELANKISFEMHKFYMDELK